MKATPDGGWGWMVVLATFMSCFLSAGSGYAFGVLYVAFLGAFGKSKAETAWIAGINAIVSVVTSSYGVALSKRFGHRKIVMAGGVLASAGVCTSAFTTQLHQVYITFGVITGIGMGLSYVPCIDVLGLYFDTRFSIACGLAMAGTGAGQFVLSVVTKALEDKYGWRGTLLILSGIFLHLCLAGAVLRPLPVHEPRAIIQLSIMKPQAQHELWIPFVAALLQTSIHQKSKMKN
ncbi:monocarboxylate transporter 13-like isoform X2 [Ptychodera flava]